MDKLLPIGSVVLLQDSTKKVMIMGLCQREVSEEKLLWDYAGVLFPEGYMGANKVFLFNRDQIESVYYIGYQDEEQLKFLEMMDEFIKNKRNEE